MRSCHIVVLATSLVCSLSMCLAHKVSTEKAYLRTFFEKKNFFFSFLFSFLFLLLILLLLSYIRLASLYVAVHSMTMLQRAFHLFVQLHFKICTYSERVMWVQWACLPRLLLTEVESESGGRMCVVVTLSFSPLHLCALSVCVWHIKCPLKKLTLELFLKKKSFFFLSFFLFSFYY